MRSLLLMATLFALAPSAFAQIYNCSVAGKTVFSDKPCTLDSQPITIKPASGSGRVERPAVEEDVVGDSPNTEATPADEAAPPAGLSESERANNLVKRRILWNEIQRQERHVKGLEAEMQARIRFLQSERRRANNNLAGATWEGSLADEMNAVSKSYATRIEGARAELERLRKERDAIPTH